MTDNPYASPTSTEVANPRLRPSDREELAGRFTRFSAALVDGLLMTGILLPIQYLTGFIERAQLAEVGVYEQLGMALLGLAVMLLLNGYLLYSRGQSIGKLLTKIQIVDHNTSALLPFFRVFVLRHLWTLPVVILTALIPGVGDDIVFNLIVMVDILLIFGVGRRCFHDFLAGSIVVLYQEGRPRL